MRRPGLAKPSRLAVGLTALAGLGLAIAGATRLADRATHAFLHRDRMPVAELPREEGLRGEHVKFLSQDGLRLAAWYFPSRNGAAVVVCHGLGVNRGEVMDFARFLCRAGYGALLFDFRAHGESEGEIISLGYYEALDVIGAAEFLKTRPDVEPEKIGLIGVSLGGSAAVLAAAQYTDLRAVVVDSTFTSVTALVRRQFRNFINLPAWFAPLIVWAGQRQLKVKVSLIQPVAAIARISPRPLLVIHGSADELIDVENGLELYRAAREPKELWIVHDSPHAQGIVTHGDEYVRRVVGFFDRAFQIARPEAPAAEE